MRSRRPGARSASPPPSAGIEVLATELYGDATLPRDEVLQRFTGGASGVTVYAVDDYKSPYASGSAKVDAYVICPCSMSTVGTLAAGAMANLIHRAASVALKEGRKLVLVPRETPLSLIHLNGLATLHQAGAVILFAAPGFYHGRRRSTTSSTSSSPGSSTSSGSTTRSSPGGASREPRVGNAAGGGRPLDVRSDRAGLRPDEPGHDRGARPALAPPHRPPGRLEGRPGARRLLRHGRSRDRGPKGRGRGRRARLLRRDARARAAQGSVARVDPGRPARASVRGRVLRRGDRRLRRPQRRRPRARPRRAEPRAEAGRPRRHPRDHAAAGPVAVLLQALVRGSDPARRQGPPRRQGVHVSARRACAAFPVPTSSRSGCGGRASARSTYRRLGGGIVALHTGTKG